MKEQLRDRIDADEQWVDKAVRVTVMGHQSALQWPLWKTGPVYDERARGTRATITRMAGQGGRARAKRRRELSAIYGHRSSQVDTPLKEQVA